jgi:hypothetical protein
MKWIGRLMLLLALSVPLLTGCGQPEQASYTAFEALARWVPGEVEQAFFLDFKPGGEAGLYWEEIRRKLEANPEGAEALAGIQGEFKIEEYGLDEVIAGPAVNGYWQAAYYVIAQVGDEVAAEGVLRQHFQDVDWDQVEFEGKTLYQAKILNEWGQREWLAWTVYNGLWFLARGYERAVLPQLQELVSLPEREGLAALPAWKSLRSRLPEQPLGLIFLNVAEQTIRNPSSPGDRSPGAIFGQRLEAVALAAVPEAEGMRVEVAGRFKAGGKVPPELQTLFDLPAVDPNDWPGLPANAALALFMHDASVGWPWLKDIFSLDVDSLEHLRDILGLDLEAVLLASEGPLTGDFAVGVTPPLPDQPISEGLTAAQLLILARDATQAQADGVRAAMENRGAVFGAGEFEGVVIQTQVGTAATGYAISYGFDDQVLYLGSSPDVIGQGIVAQREGDGAIKTEAFQKVLKALPDEPTLVAYLHTGLLTEVVAANVTEEEFKAQGELLLLQSFEALGVGLRLEPGGMDGVIYFLMGE